MEIVIPSILGVMKKQNSFRDVIWKWISFGRCKIFFIMNEFGDRVHKSMLIGKNYKFPFLKKAEYEIGPCYTQEKYRGRGFYPFVLNYIVEKNPDKKFFMLVADSNKSSIRGIEKAKFKNIGYTQRNRWGRWVRL